MQLDRDRCAISKPVELLPRSKVIQLFASLVCDPFFSCSLYLEEIVGHHYRYFAMHLVLYLPESSSSACFKVNTPQSSWLPKCPAEVAESAAVEDTPDAAHWVRFNKSDAEKFGPLF